MPLAVKHDIDLSNSAVLPISFIVNTALRIREILVNRKNVSACYKN